MARITLSIGSTAALSGSGEDGVPQNIASGVATYSLSEDRQLNSNATFRNPNAVGQSIRRLREYLDLEN